MFCFGKLADSVSKLEMKRKPQAELAESKHIYSNFYFKLEDKKDKKESFDNQKNNMSTHSDNCLEILTHLTTRSLKLLPGTNKTLEIYSWLDSLHHQEKINDFLYDTSGQGDAMYLTKPKIGDSSPTKQRNRCLNTNPKLDSKKDMPAQYASPVYNIYQKNLLH